VPPACGASAGSQHREGGSGQAHLSDGKYGRRGRSRRPRVRHQEPAVPNLEHLSPAQFAKVTDILGSDLAGQEIAAAWIAKEKLRAALNLRARVTGSAPCERNVRDRLFAFYDWCACNDDIPELVSLARTISRWEDQILCAVLTGITNATSESLNRLAKLEARLAYGSAIPRTSAGASASPGPAAHGAHHAAPPPREHTR
jgi:transposase